jgi:hypothetical protein
MPPFVISGDLRHMGKVSVMDGTEDALGHGIYLNALGDASSVLYSASSTDGTAPSGNAPPVATDDEIGSNVPVCRLRVGSSSIGHGFIVENDLDEVCMTVRGKDGRAYFAGDLSVGGSFVPSSRPEGFTYSVGTGGDFADLQEAVDALSVSTKRAGHGPLRIVLNEGHELTKGVVFRNGDYSHLHISSVEGNNIVALAPTFDASPSDAIIRVIDARGPTLAFRIDAAASGDASGEHGIHGIHVSGAGASLIFADVSGVTGSDADGLVVRGVGACVQASREGGGATLDFSGATSRAIRVVEGGSVLLSGGSLVANGCGGGGDECVLISDARSVCVLDGSKFGDYIGQGVIIRVVNSTASLEGVEMDSATAATGLSATGLSVVNAQNLVCDGRSNIDVAVLVDAMSSVDLTDSSLYDWTGNALRVTRGGRALVGPGTSVDADGLTEIEPNDTNVSSFNESSSNGIVYKG